VLIVGVISMRVDVLSGLSWLRHSAAWRPVERTNAVVPGRCAVGRDDGALR